MALTDVRLRRVTHAFGGVPAIRHVDLDVARGERVWLCGPNGSGKSTLLRVVATALAPVFGEGSVLGFDLRSGRDEIRARTELLGHGFRLYADLTARENLRFVCRLYGVPPDRLGPALERVGLDEVADVRTGGFSQGMRQRVALARCLLRDPVLLLLDEPYAGLDTDARVLVDDLLADAARCGRTVLIASHEAPPPGSVDRRIVLEAGRVLPETPGPARGGRLSQRATEAAG
jgi:ABC-type multidrug transport system ATPase subunit